MMEAQTLCYTVSQLLGDCDRLLKNCFPTISVQGEVSNLMQARSGHWYFSLKDTHGSVRCACFKRYAEKQAPLKEGDFVTILAQVSIYQARGDFQLIVTKISLAGEGELKRRFEALKQQLSQEGLFDETGKKPLPKYPFTLGIITSPTGAALHDILTTLKRRAPFTSVIIYPCLVQGNQAKESICKAIDQAESHGKADLLILARGGGSLEDLWPFNEATVARKLASCTLPVISGVGHEVDTTIADLVADQRAATPTAAAEMACPDQMTLMNLIDTNLRQLLKHWQKKHQDSQQRLHQIQAQLKHPKHTINQHMQSVDYMLSQLYHHMKHLLQHKKLSLTQPIASLDALNPSKLLQSGYTMTLKDNKAISSTHAIQAGDTLNIRFHDGNARAKVLDVDFK